MLYSDSNKLAQGRLGRKRRAVQTCQRDRPKVVYLSVPLQRTIKGCTLCALSQEVCIPKSFAHTLMAAWNNVEMPANPSPLSLLASRVPCSFSSKPSLAFSRATFDLDGKALLYSCNVLRSCSSSRLLVRLSARRIDFSDCCTAVSTSRS